MSEVQDVAAQRERDMREAAEREERYRLFKANLVEEVLYLKAEVADLRRRLDEALS